MSDHIFSQEEELKKALEAPASVSDMQTTSGGVITEQDLEKKPASLTFSEDDAVRLIKAAIGVIRDEIPRTEQGYRDHFKDDVEFADKSYRLFNKCFKK